MTTDPEIPTTAASEFADLTTPPPPNQSILNALAFLCERDIDLGPSGQIKNDYEYIGHEQATTVTATFYHSGFKTKNALRHFKQVLGPFPDPSDEAKRAGYPTLENRVTLPSGGILVIQYASAFVCERRDYDCKPAPLPDGE